MLDTQKLCAGGAERHDQTCFRIKGETKPCQLQPSECNRSVQHRVYLIDLSSQLPVTITRLTSRKPDIGGAWKHSTRTVTRAQDQTTALWGNNATRCCAALPGYYLCNGHYIVTHHSRCLACCHVHSDHNEDYFSVISALLWIHLYVPMFKSSLHNIWPKLNWHCNPYVVPIKLP